MHPSIVTHTETQTGHVPKKQQQTSQLYSPGGADISQDHSVALHGCADYFGLAAGHAAHAAGHTRWWQLAAGFVEKIIIMIITMHMQALLCAEPNQCSALMELQDWHHTLRGIASKIVHCA